MEEKKIREIVAGVLQTPMVDLPKDASLGVTEGWDSLAQLEILEKLEAASSKRLSGEDSLFAESLEDLLALFSFGGEGG